jgi:hypothetical protein
MSKALFDASCEDFLNIGYIEVIESSSFVVRTTRGEVDEAGTVEATPVDKDLVKDYYEEFVDAIDLVKGAEYESRDILTGHMELSAAALGLGTGMMRADVFEDWDNLEVLDATEVTGLGANDSRNTLGELEAAMSKDQVYAQYVNMASDAAVHFLTFPTKISSFDDDCDYTGPAWGSPFFGESRFYDPVEEEWEQCVKYTNPNYDLQENEDEPEEDPFSGGDKITLELCDEVNLRAGFPFSEGWSRYVFNYTTDFTVDDPTEVQRDYDYTGAPVLPAVVYLGESGLSMSKAAWDDGSVTVDGLGVVDNYQYADVPN